MNLGAGQPASLPYGVESPMWYSNQCPYHSVQFSSSPQQWDLPFSSSGYHRSPPSYHPPPLSYHPPPPPNPYSGYAYHPSGYAHHPYQQSYPPTVHHFNLTNQFVPPYTTHELPPPISEPEPDPQLCSIPQQVHQISDPEVSVIDSKHSSSFSCTDARMEEFLESMSRLLDRCISTCLDGIRSSKGLSPSLLDDGQFQSPEPKSYTPSIVKPTPLLVDAESRIKQAAGGSIPITRRVKKRKYLKRTKLLMHKLSFKTDVKFKQRTNVSVMKDEQGPSLFVKGREYHALHLFDRMSKS